MKKYQYMIRSWNYSEQSDPQQHLAELNAKGGEGWELVSVIFPDHEPQRGLSLTAFFKREIVG